VDAKEAGVRQRGPQRALDVAWAEVEMRLAALEAEQEILLSW
jgi:hypothetical protein